MTEATFDTAQPQSQTERRRGRTARRFVPHIAGATAGVLALGYGLHWWLAARFIETTDNAYVRADVVVISPRVAGYIADVAVSDNQGVHRGDLLAQIDDATYQARFTQSRASVAAARADIEVETAAIATLDAQIAEQGSLIVEAEARFRAAEADARRATLELQRQQILAQQQISTVQRLENAEADERKTAATQAGAQAALGSQREHLAVLTVQRQGKAASLDKARAALQQAEATLEVATIDLASTAIRAPTDGVVGQRVARPGQYVEPGSPLLAVVPHASYVVANYKETQVNRISIGQPVEIEIDAFASEALRGHVDSFAPASGAQFALLPPDNATGNFTKIVQRMPIRIVIDPDQPDRQRLRPGMSAVTRIDTRRTEHHDHAR
ncbi:HlyD family secretion protein [Bradyrhizobium sp. 33ap4]|uniref:HlyD family secretion protein n=1 Tax=Bradyrhizobium sp. 33ap4 TaxID=3061630 RepID=UPI0029314A55|nr:HlyD family secretion protein [Bradyrhizobium sp. 33ap4]